MSVCRCACVQVRSVVPGAAGAGGDVGVADVVGLHLAGVWHFAALAPLPRHSPGRWRRRLRRCCLSQPSLLSSLALSWVVSLFFVLFFS